MIDQPRSRACNGATLTPLTIFGATWLREDELADAAGCRLIDVFRAFVRDAKVYGQNARRTYVDTRRGPQLMAVYSLDGALQIALYLRSVRHGSHSRRANALIDALHQIRTAGFAGEIQEARA